MQSRRDLLKSVCLLPLASEILPQYANAQQSIPSIQPKWLKDIATQLRDEFNLPAVWIAANVEDKVEAAVVGVRKVGDPTLATLDDKLTVASISKPMAGLWVATLVDRNKLTYDTKVLEVLTELQSICLPEHKDITLGQLLTHTAGVIRDVKSFPNALKLEQYPSERLRQAREVLSTPAPSGTKGKEVYSNNGATLAATMAERAAGEPYENAAGRLYRERLGLTSWGVWPMNLPDDLAVPWPHSIKDKTPVPQPPQSVQFQFVRPSGSAHCTITDLVRFGLIATNSTGVARSLLKHETWQIVLEHGDKDRTTLGSFYAGGHDLTVFNHGGSLGITSSHLRVLPEWKASFAFHTNATGDEFRARGIELMQDAVRKRRTERHPPVSCRIALTGVATVDASWQNVIVPKTTDDKVRIRVNFQIEAEPRTGDLQTLVKLGDVERRDNRFNGLASGNHTLHFEFDTPKTKITSTVVKVDALGTAGNQSRKAATFEAVLTLR